MSGACASVYFDGLAGAAVMGRPVVFVDGVLEPRLEVVDAEAKGVLDLRRCELKAAMGVTEEVSRQWRNAEVVVAEPMRLNDGSIRWQVLAHGMIRPMRKQERAGSVSTAGLGRWEDRWEVIDHWAQAMEQRVEMSVWEEEGRLVVTEAKEPGEKLRVGAQANRSVGTWLVGEKRVYVLMERGERWSVGQALKTCAAFAGVDLQVGLLSSEISEAVLTQEVDLRQSVGRVLEEILTGYGLMVRLELGWDGRVMSRRAVVLPVEGTRKVMLTWGDREEGNGLSHVMQVQSRGMDEGARLWTARGAGWLVESTFALQGGWERSLEGQPAGKYSKADNVDFSTYANVYRLWVLNEDGQFTGTGFGDNTTFHLADFFDDVGVRQQRMRLEPCVTLDGGGLRRSVVVEMSVDSGAVWQTYPGVAKVLADRAGVYLDDVTLPGGFLTAALAGTARIRVTGSLRSPMGVEVKRWEGNPFVRILPGVILETGNTFSFAKVAAESIHAAAVAGGTLQAGVADDRRAMEQWLLGQMWRQKRTDMMGRGRSVLQLTGARTWLACGDQVEQAGGAGRNADGSSAAVKDRPARITQISWQWPVQENQMNASTQLQLAF